MYALVSIHIEITYIQMHVHILITCTYILIINYYIYNIDVYNTYSHIHILYTYQQNELKSMPIYSQGTFTPVIEVFICCNNDPGADGSLVRFHQES